MSFHSLSIILFSIGLRAVFKFHSDKNIPDLYSLHRFYFFKNSWVGLATVICYISLYLVGIIAFILKILSEE